MSAATIIAEAFGEGADLYTAVLALPSAGPDVTAAQLRKAYYKRALIFHPDKQKSKSHSEIEDAKLKFQAVSVAYSILSNPESRAEYDESGELYDEDDDMGRKSGTEAWDDYFKSIFGKVTVEDIDKFEAQYKCSDEEEQDVLKYYRQFKGDLNKMLECVMLSRDVDKKRWVEDFIKPATERGDVEYYKEALERTMGSCSDEEPEEDDEETESEEDSEEEKKTKSTSKKRAAEKAPPQKKGGNAKHRIRTAAKKKKGKAVTGEGLDEDLVAAIRGRAVARSEASFNAMLNGLEDRYSGGKKSGRGKKKSSGSEVPDIPDDEFDKLQARLEKNRKSKKK